MSATTKGSICNELAKTPGLWMDTAQIQKAFKKTLPTTVARALRKLRHEGKVLSQAIPGDRYGRKKWRFNKTGSSLSAPTPVTQPQPTRSKGNGNGKGIMSKPTLLAAVTTIVDDFVKATKTFSAHDVTSELRDRVNTGVITIDTAETGTCHVNGKDVARIVHNEIRDHIHDLFGQGAIAGYDRTNNGSYWAYAPAVDDGDDDDQDDDSDDDGVASVGVSGGSYDGSSSL